MRIFGTTRSVLAAIGNVLLNQRPHVWTCGCSGGSGGIVLRPLLRWRGQHILQDQTWPNLWRGWLTLVHDLFLYHVPAALHPVKGPCGWKASKAGKTLCGEVPEIKPRLPGRQVHSLVVIFSDGKKIACLGASPNSGAIRIKKYKRDGKNGSAM
jgi:hypothetical protein